MSSVREQIIEEAAREALRFLAIDRVAVGAGPNQAASPWSDGLPELADEREHWQSHVIGELTAALRGADHERQRGAARPASTPSTGDEVTMYLDPETGETKQGAPDFAGDSAEPSVEASAVTESEKRCIRCKNDKALSGFREDKRSKDGHRRMCLACEAESDPAGPAPASAAKEDAALPRSREDSPAKGAVVSSDTTARESAASRSRACANGESCVSYSQLGAPAKLSKRNNDSRGRCYPCADAEIDRAAGPGFGRAVS